MGTIDNGTQRISYDYRERGLAEGFNKINYKLHSKGIYAGGSFTRVSDSEITIAPLVCVYNDVTNKLSVRLETTTNASVTSISSTTPWIVGRFIWANTDDNYMDFLCLAEENILSSDLILGYIDYNGATMTTDFDYTRKSWQGAYYLNLNSTPFKVYADEPYSDSVVVGVGGPYFFNGRWIELAIETTSPAISFPISAFGRKDVVVIDSLDNSVKIIEGSNLNNSLPEVDTQYYPVAVINLPANEMSLVKGNYIEYFHTNKITTAKDTATGILSKLKTVDGTGSTIDLDTLGGLDSSYYTNIINDISYFTQLQFLPTRTPSTVVDWQDNQNSPQLSVANNRLFFEYLMTSDGVNFSSLVLGGSYPITKKVNYGNSRYVTLRNGSSVSPYYSSNGTTWSQGTLLSSTYTSVSDAIYGSGLFLTVGVGTSNDYILSSTDGNVWTARLTASNTTYRLSRFSTNGTVTLLTNTENKTYYYSTNGTSWTKYTLPIEATAFPISITYHMGYFYSFGKECYKSSDGLAWEYVGIIDSSTPAFSAGEIVAVDNTFYYISTKGIYISWDLGLNWFYLPIPNAITNARIFNNKLYLLSYTGTVSTSVLRI